MLDESLARTWYCHGNRGTHRLFGTTPKMPSHTTRKRSVDYHGNSIVLRLSNRYLQYERQKRGVFQVAAR